MSLCFVFVFFCHFFLFVIFIPSSLEQNNDLAGTLLPHTGHAALVCFCLAIHSLQNCTILREKTRVESACDVIGHLRKKSHMLRSAWIRLSCSRTETRIVVGTQLDEIIVVNGTLLVTYVYYYNMYIFPNSVFFPHFN